MKTRITVTIFVCLGVLMVESFKTGEKTISDKELLDIVSHHDQIPLFNYLTKMAAVDTRPYNPNDPKVFPPTTLFKSRSTDTTTHGGKIFRLRAKKDSEYAYDLNQPEGQVLHMATFYYEQAKTSLGDGKSLKLSDSLYLNPTTRSNFYLMLKTNSKDHPTDGGWVYAVVSPDGQKVLQKGLITSCMGCHGASKVDRMLGAR